MSAVRIEIQTKDFFRLSPKKLEIEETLETGRLYFIHAGRIGRGREAGRQGCSRVTN